MIGGSLMAAVGILYLMFEDKLLADFSGSIKPQPSQKENRLSRALVGVQVSRYGVRNIPFSFLTLM